MSLDNELCIINDKYEEVKKTIKLLKELKAHKSNPIEDIDKYIKELNIKQKELENEQARVSNLLAEWAMSFVD